MKATFYHNQFGCTILILHQNKLIENLKLKFKNSLSIPEGFLKFVFVTYLFSFLNIL